MPPLAHQLWFVDHVPARDWSFAAEPLTLAYLALAVAIALGVRLLARRVDGVPVPALARLVPWLPFVARLHLAVSLVGLLSAGHYLAPSMDLPNDVGGVALGAVMAVTAVLLLTGYRTRVAALLLVAAGPLGMAVFGIGPVLQRVDVLGLALFLLVTGGGRWSADEELGRATAPAPWQLEQAVWLLRVATGVALIVVAFVEKLANPGLAVAFLEAQPTNLNVAAAFGLPVGDLEFVRIAGVVEVLFGLLLISGALPQLVVVAAGIPFNATLYFFGTIELLGHLPVYGTMLILLVLGSDPLLGPRCRRLWPWSEARVGVRAPAP